MNIHVNELPPEHCEKYRKTATLLGFKFAVRDHRTDDATPDNTSFDSSKLRAIVSTPDQDGPVQGPPDLPVSGRKATISGDPAADNMIARLNESIRTIYTLRKYDTNIR